MLNVWCACQVYQGTDRGLGFPGTPEGHVIRLPHAGHHALNVVPGDVVVSVRPQVPDLGQLYALLFE